MGRKKKAEEREIWEATDLVRRLVFQVGPDWHARLPLPVGRAVVVFYELALEPSPPCAYLKDTVAKVAEGIVDHLGKKWRRHLPQKLVDDLDKFMVGNEYWVANYRGGANEVEF